MRNFIIFALLFMAGTVYAAQESNLSSIFWKNRNNDASWVFQPTNNDMNANVRKKTSPAVSELFYETKLVHPVNVFATITPVVRLAKTDGRGLNITDAKGVSYFLTLGDDYEAGIYCNKLPGLSVYQKYYDFIPASDPFRMQVGTTYDVKYHVSNNLVSFEVKGKGINKRLMAKVDVTFPITIKLVAQRSETIFSGVKITSITGQDRDADGKDGLGNGNGNNGGGNDKKDCKEPKAPKANG